MQIEIRDILRDYGALFDRVAASYEANQALRQELTQEIVLHVWQALKQFRGDSQLKTYVLKIAHNRGVQHVAKEAKRMESYIDDSITLADHRQLEQQAQERQQLALLSQFIRQLPIAQRQIITLHLEGISYQEIAEIAGCTVNYVGVQINRIKTKLQEALNHANA